MSRAALAAAAALVASPAFACPVCGGGGANAAAYLDMTIFLSLFPLTILGGFAGVIWYLHKLAEAPPKPRGQDAERQRA